MNSQDLQKELEEIEKALRERTKVLEQETGNDENQVGFESEALTGSISDILRSLEKTLARHWEAEAALLNQKTELQKQIDFQHSSLAEMEMERDVLLERLHSYLETNSSLKIRLEEQRCQTAALQRQLEGGSEELQKERTKMNLKFVLEESSKCLAEEEMDRIRKSLEEAKRREEEANNKLKEVLEEKRKLEQENRNLRSIGLATVLRQGNEGWRKWKSEEDVRHVEKSSGCAKLSPPTFESNTSRPKLSDHHPKVSETAVQDQLNALKSGLVYVTQKLQVLKSQIANSSTFREEPQEGGKKDEEWKKPRSLKRKAEVFEQQDTTDVQEPQKTFKNLKDILEDAKSLNAKLQTLREEKQRMLESGGGPEKEKREKGSQTAAPAFLQLKNSVAEFEEKLDDGLITREEAYGGLISALSACVFGEGKSVASPTACRHSREVEKENGGGGDNMSKAEMRETEDLKLQMARLKAEIEHLHN